MLIDGARDGKEVRMRLGVVDGVLNAEGNVDGRMVGILTGAKEVGTGVGSLDGGTLKVVGSAVEPLGRFEGEMVGSASGATFRLVDGVMLVAQLG